MPEMLDVPLADLLVDTANARLPTEHSSQQDALLGVAMELRDKLLRLAEGIRRHGLDPLRPIAVRPADEEGKFVVVEGNRRLAALKALEAPGIVEAAYDVAGRRRLNRLVTAPARVPVDPVRCMVFRTPKELDDLDHWVTLLHTGPNDGEGLVEWGSEEKDRHLARRGRRSLGGQVLEVVRAATGKEFRGRSAREGFITTVQRLVSNPKVRERLGVGLIGGELVSHYPPEEVVKGLIRIVEDLAAGHQDSRTLHSKAAREAYAAALPARALPSRRTRLSQPIPLHVPKSLAPSGPSTAPRKGPGRRGAPAVRKHLVPRSCHLNITVPRIRMLFTELCAAPLEQNRNLCAVGLRVFVELSVDHTIEAHTLMTEQLRRQTPLAKRMKLVASHLERAKGMPKQLGRAIERIADGTRGVLAASVITWHDYVHNKYVHPKTEELRDAWDELEPFLAFLWP